MLLHLMFLCADGLSSTNRTKVVRHHPSPEYRFNCKCAQRQVAACKLAPPGFSGTHTRDLCALETAKYPTMHFLSASDSSGGNINDLKRLRSGTGSVRN